MQAQLALGSRRRPEWQRKRSFQDGVVGTRECRLIVHRHPSEFRRHWTTLDVAMSTIFVSLDTEHLDAAAEAREAKEKRTRPLRPFFPRSQAPLGNGPMQPQPRSRAWFGIVAAVA